MYSKKARLVSKFPFLNIFLILIKQKLLSIFKIRKKNYVWFYDLSNLILTKIVKNKLLKNKIDNQKNIVLSGPFKNIIIDYNIFTPAQIIGLYEHELHSLINIILKKDYNTLVNIGLSNGYYFLGLLKYGNFNNGIAIDIDTQYFKNVSQLININSIKLPITFFDSFNKIKKNNIDKNNNLFFIDIEGSEIDFINKYQDVLLKKSDILVETHSLEIFVTIKKKFNKTHKITEVFNQSMINYDLPNIIKNKDTFNSVDRLVMSGSLRKDRTPWLFLEKF